MRCLYISHFWDQWEIDTICAAVLPRTGYVVFSVTLRLKDHMRFVLRCYVVVDLPLLRVAVEGSDNPITSEQP